ncbi:hypothetical protein HYC85_024595 [Camellia sinensis]|uniref:Calponin-homology (CH) domain-containing protein n=1 Tax=Camellia sinensis TaxID=4442 RepID=A0A7J7G8N0_CAMSI|nr:hypothetical protein HYC85_024595 [Camellia sinensis]
MARFDPSEEEFRLYLRSGLILCNVLNKVQLGAVPKVDESHWDSTLIPDGAPLSAYQYFENSGKSARVVICVLPLKSYSDWKQTGANGVWKFEGNLKTVTSEKHFMRKN